MISYYLFMFTLKIKFSTRGVICGAVHSYSDKKHLSVVFWLSLFLLFFGGGAGGGGFIAFRGYLMSMNCYKVVEKVCTTACFLS